MILAGQTLVTLPEVTVYLWESESESDWYWRDSPLLMFINHLLVLVCSWQHLLFLSPHVEQGRLLEELRELESLRTSSGGAGVGAAGASANIGAGSIIPVLGGLGLVGVAAGNRCCVWQQASLALCGRHC